VKRIAIFTEGKTERIFVRECLFRLFDPARIRFECYELLAHNLLAAPYVYPSTPNPQAEVFFMIVDCHGDEGVLSTIKEREHSLIEKGYDAILGLRDMYCDAYHRLAHGLIKDNVSKRLIQAHAAEMQRMKHYDRIKLYYAIMEIEAWLLGMYDLFQKIDPILTTKYIKQELGIDLENMDPQLSFYRPSEELNAVLALCGRRYKKKEGDVERLCAKIELKDLDDVISNNRCKSFKEFRDAIVGYG
jgi:hypothetical protein